MPFSFPNALRLVPLCMPGLLLAQTRPDDTSAHSATPERPWAYRVPVRPALPSDVDAAGALRPLDALIEARLRERGIDPVAEASRVALVRRLHQDLLGLPPTPEDVAAFVADDRPDAWERLVDRLLDSPHYGERFGRHWLDVVRYAETNGYERDSDKPFVWRYRDWVVQAFNADMPYDRFVIEQLAGDELPDATPESRIATGFQRLMIWDDEPGAGRLQAKYDTLDDLVRTTTEGFLGMTLGCARCHEHKGDPIPQADYYRFMAFFHGLTDMSTNGILRDVMSADEERAYEVALRARDRDAARVSRELFDLERAFQEALVEREPELRSQLALPDLEQVHYRFYRDTWERLPAFDGLLAEDEGLLEHGHLDLAPATREEAFGFVFEGLLRVPTTGRYRFDVRAKDGVRLIVSEQRVLELDGVRSEAERRSGEVDLAAGRVPLRVEFFVKQGAPQLELSWTRVLRETWSYTLDDPGSGWARDEFDTSTWARGVAGFGRDGTPGAFVQTTWTTDDIWLRRPFPFETGEGRDAVLLVHHDEDFEAYVNGVLAARATGYLTDYRVFELREEALAALRDGENVLAVHAHQTGGGQYIHAKLVRRREIEGLTAREAVLGRYVDGRPLSLAARSGDRGRRAREGVRRWIERRGEAVWSPESLERYRALEREAAAIERRSLPERKRAPVATEAGPHPAPLHVHVRGSAHALGKAVEPGVPAVFGDVAIDVPEPRPGASSSGRRLALARWIASERNPLTARVISNRVWLHHFGRGIVDTPNDFGKLGSEPTHPELLDGLATFLIDNDWSLKSLHREIVCSSAYRRAAVNTPVGLERDPNNEWLWRFPVRRLSAEEVRDAVLALSGVLNLEMGGPSFFSEIPAEVLATSSRPDATWGRSSRRDVSRRSVYIKVKRSLLTPILQTFDLADTDASCPQRFTTSQPGQALTLLNSGFAHAYAERLAVRLRRECGDDLHAQIARAIELALARTPHPGELAQHAAFVARLLTHHGLDEEHALTMFCLLVLNLNEFLFVG
ncbi:MAG: DUF1553 domain-containing protein [Planctomycetes bacterium]|nr:DUF1553 domain-containing protein [Planctomycetota bacterium]